MTTLDWIGAALLIFIALNAYLFWLMILAAIRKAEFINEESIWTWNKNADEIHILFPEEKPVKISNVININQAKTIMANKKFKYVGSDKYLLEN